MKETMGLLALCLGLGCILITTALLNPAHIAGSVNVLVGCGLIFAILYAGTPKEKP
jgi:hypothetical protein